MSGRIFTEQLQIQQHSLGICICQYMSVYPPVLGHDTLQEWGGKACCTVHNALGLLADASHGPKMLLNQTIKLGTVLLIVLCSYHVWVLLHGLAWMLISLSTSCRVWTLSMDTSAASCQVSCCKADAQLYTEDIIRGKLIGLHESCH